MNKCPVCEYPAKNYRSYKIHFSKSHPNEYKQYEQELKQSTTQDYEFYCKICGPNTRFKTYKGLQIHSSHDHNISGKELYMLHHDIAEVPKCECGCGQDVNFFGGNGGWFGKFINGHSSRVNGGFYSPIGAKRSGETRKRKFASGELVQYNKGIKLEGDKLLKAQQAAKSPERRKKISDKLKGRVLSPEHIAKITEDRKKYWGDPIHREEQRHRRVEYMTNHLKQKKTKLETKFEKLLQTIFDTEYITQHPVNGYNYDFYLPKYNVLIEVDGDYWHCNESIGIYPTSKSQLHTLQHDKIKNQNAKDLGYKLIRFWEYDINNNTLSVIQKLIETINSV
jgi:very-short-patch-repair endonuclease